MAIATTQQIKDLRNAPPTLITTKYCDGAQFGLRRISRGVAKSIQALFGPEGKAEDPDRVAREVLKIVVIDPALDDEAIEGLESDFVAFDDLCRQVMAFAGFSPAAQTAAQKTFPEGALASGEQPAGS
jgi:hypothetical protein